MTLIHELRELALESGVTSLKSNTTASCAGRDVLARLLFSQVLQNICSAALMTASEAPPILNCQIRSFLRWVGEVLVDPLEGSG